jgi:protein gp37
MPYEGLVKLGKQGPQWTSEGRFVTDKLDEPLRWKKPARVFVNSMSDLFFEEFSNEQIAAVFGVMAAASQHTFQVLTKRPQRMLEWFAWVEKRGEDGLRMFPYDDLGWRIRQMLSVSAGKHRVNMHPNRGGPWPLPNVHLGVSVENQATADERIPVLLQVPAAVRWVSYEPALGPVKFGDVPGQSRVGATIPDWIVIGSESGPGARPMQIEWADNAVKQCKVAGVACFVKQIATPSNRKGNNMTKWPKRANGEPWPREYPR